MADDFPTKQPVLGFTMTGPLNLGDNGVYGVDDTVTNKSTANKQYFGHKKAFFKDQSTTTEGVDL